MRTSIALLLALALTACGGDDTGADASSDGSADATTDTASSDAASDAATDAAPSCTTYEAGPAFTCYQQSCTGSVAQFCENVTDGGAGLKGSECVDTPAACTCLGMHTCKCILANLPNPCDGGTPKCTGAGAYQQAYVTCP